MSPYARRAAQRLLATSAMSFCAFCPQLFAQQPMGTVATHDAHISGAIDVRGDHAILLSNASVTAGDHAATIDLARGGEALVCATSQFHLLHAGNGPALFFGLDRGAVELRGATQPQDVILTPDLRISVEHAGILDLRLRVTPDGDTCVENRGAGAPVLVFNGSFSSASYRLMPSQHVLFEHGDLRQVVDHERSNCGCPSAQLTPQQLAANASEAERVAAANPFPEAQSVGLSTVPETPTTTPPAGSVIIATNPARNTVPIPIAPETSSSLTPQQPHGFFHAIGQFFHRLFGASNGSSP